MDGEDQRGNRSGSCYIVYVDDIAVFGPELVAKQVAGAFMAKWKTSTPMWPSPTTPVSFCGMEMARIQDGWRITQSRYLREVLRRYEIEGTTYSPMPKWKEPEEEQASTQEVREAQAITGAILWSVTRTRPDLMFVAARMSQYSTRTPRAVRSWGYMLLSMWLPHCLWVWTHAGRTAAAVPARWSCTAMQATLQQEAKACKAPSPHGVGA